MSARFADLMALSASQTREQDLTTQTLLAQKRLKEETARKEREERERKAKEIETRRVRQELEAKARLEAELERKAEEKRKREERQLRLEEEQKQALLYGPPKASRSNGGHGGGRANGASRAGKGDKRSGSDDDMEGGAMALTREEKRQKKLLADMNKGSSSSARKATTAGGYGKRGKVLKGGAIDTTVKSVFSFAATTGNEHLSVKARIAATPNYLQKLNTVKRDTRTIDEIVRDRQKLRETKVLNGDEAKDFHDWFSTKPKKDPFAGVQKVSSSQHSATSTPTRALTPNSLPSSQPAKSSAPVTTASQSTNKSSNGTSARPPQRDSPRPDVSSSQPKTKITLVKPQQPSSFLGKASPKSTTPAPKFPSQPSTSARPSTFATAGNGRPRSSSVHRARSSSNPKKRAHSESLDDDSEFDESRSPSPPPKKRSFPTSSGKNDISSQIWQMFGKDRSTYMRDDVFSDEDDDMEVDAEALRREEMRSARLARKEDDEALKEEARHEEEKRRKRKEKEVRDRRY